MVDTIGTVGRCVYCGANSYTPDSDEPVHHEHVIPDALSGSYLLKEASCQSCERKINPWETALLRGGLYAYRLHLNLKSKRPKERPDKLPLYNKDSNQKVMVALEDMPLTLGLPYFRTPNLLRAEGVPVGALHMWMHCFAPPDDELLRRKYNLNGFATEKIDTFALCRTLAKIAHCIASVVPGLDAFEQFLPAYILGDSDEKRFDYIGGVVGETNDETRHLHSVEIEAPPTGHADLLVVRITLFAPLGAPTYRVVVGRRIAGVPTAQFTPPNHPPTPMLAPAWAGLTAKTFLPIAGEAPRYLRAAYTPSR